MKIVFVVKYYENYIANLEKKIPDIELLSYDELMEKANLDFFIMYNSFNHYLNEMEGVSSQVLIPNWQRPQEKWKRENNCREDITLLEICEEQIKSIGPDILFFNSNFEYYTIIPKVRSHVKKICTWISCPLPKQLDLSPFDQIFTLFPPHKKHFESLGIKTTLTTAGFDPRVLDHLKKGNPKTDISFVGGIGKFHKKREADLKYLIKRSPILLWGYGYTSDNKLKNLAKQVLSRFAFTRRFVNKAWGLDMFQVLYDSKITFNSHADLADDFTVNMRLYEATGVGTLLVTEYSEDIKKMFVPDEEIICYRSIEEAYEKIKYFSAHEEERARIAMAGQAKTLSRFSYKDISVRMMEEFKALLASS